MAKGKRNKADKQDKPEPTAPEGKSLLGVAWKAYQAGDMVLARRAAKLVLAGGGKEADEAVAKKLGRELFGASPRGDAGQVAKKLDQELVGASPPVVDARLVAQDLITRTNPAPKPFLLAGAAALIWVVLLAIAARG